MKSLLVAHKHWFNLSHNEVGEQSYYNLEESLIESQILLEMEELKEKITYDNQCDDTEHLEISSKEAWTSAFYHIQKATYRIAEQLKIDNISIQNRLRDTNSHFLLVSSITNEETEEIISSKLNSEIQKELDLASRLMEKWDGKVTILPTVSSIPAIAVKWSKEVTSETDDQTITALAADRKRYPFKQRAVINRQRWRKQRKPPYHPLRMQSGYQYRQPVTWRLCLRYS